MVKKIKPLTKKSVAATMAIKCYDEQLVLGADGIVKSIKNINKDEFQVIAINHNKTDEKEHWHILVRAVSREKKFQVASMMKRLNVQFRDCLDDDLWEHHGVETVGDFCSYATYLLHNTIEARRSKKAQYKITDIITNLSQGELQQVLDGYSITKKTLRKGELNVCMDQAREAGYNLESFYEFLDKLNITGLKDTEEKQLRNSYLAGVRRMKAENVVIDRLCIIISYDGTPEIKKQLLFAVDKALENKTKVFITRNMKYIVEPSVDAVITTWERDKLVDNKFLWSDGIGESTSKKSDISGIWAGKYFIAIAKDEYIKRCIGDKVFGFKVVEGKIIEHYKPISYYEVDEYDRLQKMYDDIYKKFIEEYDLT